MGKYILVAMATMCGEFIIFRWDNLQGNQFEHFCHISCLPQDINMKGVLVFRNHLCLVDWLSYNTFL